ncbi:hypothetical protein BH11PAT3_BH11PAT3_0970 [soil metagenome]
MSQKNFYIIPGWEDNCTDEAYVKIADMAKKKAITSYVSRLIGSFPFRRRNFQYLKILWYLDFLLELSWHG